MRSTAAAAQPYARLEQDAVRATFELPWFGRLVPRLLREAGGGELLDLGCGDAAVARLAPPGLKRYVGVDLAPRADLPVAELVRHDLRDGLGPVGARPFDLYLGTFGVASHLGPQELRRLLGEIAAHARPGAMVAIEALGLYSLEWPQLWDSPPGRARKVGYRLASEVLVHPWSPPELFRMLGASGIRPLWAADRTIQAGPKTGDGSYWPGLPAVRRALNGLLGEAPAEADELTAPLPPLPAGEAALVHHTLAARRRTLLRDGPRPASAVWGLEPPIGGGYGHGLLVVGRVDP